MNTRANKAILYLVSILSCRRLASDRRQDPATLQTDKGSPVYLLYLKGWSMLVQLQRTFEQILSQLVSGFRKGFDCIIEVEEDCKAVSDERKACGAPLIDLSKPLSSVSLVNKQIMKRDHVDL